MKKANVSWSYMIWGLLGLIVLVVAIGLLYILTQGPREGVNDVNQVTESEGLGSIIDFKNLFGKCEPNDRRCRFGKYIDCKDGKWVDTKIECNEKES